MRRKLEGNEDEARRGRAPSKLPVWMKQTTSLHHLKKAFLDLRNGRIDRFIVPFSEHKNDIN